MAQYRVFYSKDCMMWGVERLVVDNGSGRKMFWQQVLPPKGKGARRGKSAYTEYKGVAERWLKELTD
jgi:hypothetical protein